MKRTIPAAIALLATGPAWSAKGVPGYVPPPLPDIARKAEACDATQQQTIDEAATYTLGMVDEVLDKLRTTPADLRAGTIRYEWWMGEATDEGWEGLESGLTRMREVLATGDIEYDCGCTDPNLFAWQQYSNTNVMQICPYFYVAPLLGTDSRAGAIAHELCHRDDIMKATDPKGIGCRDHAYGQVRAHELAVDNSALARRNADNVEYILENDPELPWREAELETPVDPDPDPVEPEPDPDPVEPDPVEPEPDPDPVDPEPEPVEPTEPEPVEPCPEPTEEEPVEPDPVPDVSEPEPTPPVVVDPTPAQPDPEPPLEPDPVEPTEPDPAPVAEEPSTPDPVEPEAVDEPTQPDPAEEEGTAPDPVEPPVVAPDPVPVEPTDEGPETVDDQPSAPEPTEDEPVADPDAPAEDQPTEEEEQPGNPFEVVDDEETGDTPVAELTDSGSGGGGAAWWLLWMMGVAYARRWRA